MKIKPFNDAGGFTTFRNSILDHIMPLCTPNEWKIICVTLRKTVGWNKSEDWISLTQYQRLTGIKSRPTVHKAVHGCLTKKLIIRSVYKDSFKYALNKKYSLEIEPAKKPTGLEIEPLTDLENKPVDSLEIEHTKENNTNTNNTKNNLLSFLKDMNISPELDILEGWEKFLLMCGASENSTHRVHKIARTTVPLRIELEELKLIIETQTDLDWLNSRFFNHATLNKLRLVFGIDNLEINPVLVTDL